MTDNVWSDNEFSTIDLGDERRTNRFLSMASSLSQKPNHTIAQACGTRSSTKGAYTLFSNDNFQVDDILQAHYDSTVERAKEKSTVLVIQDTSQLKYNGHIKTEGLGSLNREFTSTDSGLFLHPCLAITDEGMPLGLVGYSCWARQRDNRGMRDECTSQRLNKSIDDKESIKWINGLCESLETLADLDAEIINIADRESDIYPFMAKAISLNTSFIVRCRHDRTIEIDGSKTKIRKAITESPVLGTKKINVREKSKVREAKLEIRCLQAVIPKPVSDESFKHLVDSEPIPVSVVEAREVDPSTKSPVRWILITNLKVEGLNECRKALERYGLRWTIETFFKVLKSGCKIEDCRLGTAEKLEKYIALMSVVTYRLMHLTLLSRESPDQPCTAELQEIEWQTLLVLDRKSKKASYKFPSNLEAITMIAKLGGYQARRSDPPPGPIVIWRGWQKLMNSVEVVKLISET
ncbi:MAG: IS4 family transposase [Pseudobacteriovorax sp.]|nr:IS4 family transposase [Pseudobacteriovorax sp.]